MAVVLALAAACSWGASDFLGGLAGRRTAHDISVASSLAGSVIGLVGLSATAAIVGGAALSTADLGYAAGAGIGGAVGVALLYRGLAIGKMGVVAPITGAGAAAVPVVVGVAGGEAPTPLAWLGVVLALAAIVLVSREPAPLQDGPGPPADGALRGLRTRGLPEAVGAGLGFGAIFVLLERTSEAANLWPLVPMKISSVVVLVVIGLLARQPLAAPRPVWPLLLGVGILDNAANVTYLLATRRGLLALVAVVSSLYPVGTVLLARLVLDERLARHQVAGLVLAGVAVTVIATA